MFFRTVGDGGTGDSELTDDTKKTSSSPCGPALAYQGEPRAPSAHPQRGGGLGRLNNQLSPRAAHTTARPEAELLAIGRRRAKHAPPGRARLVRKAPTRSSATWWDRTSLQLHPVCSGIMPLHASSQQVIWTTNDNPVRTCTVHVFPVSIRQADERVSRVLAYVHFVTRLRLLWIMRFIKEFCKILNL